MSIRKCKNTTFAYTLAFKTVELFIVTIKQLDNFNRNVP